MSGFGAFLLVLSLAAPAVLLVACLFKALREPALGWTAIAAVPALLASAVALKAGPIEIAAPALKLSLRLDLPGALLMAVSSILWIFVARGAFAEAGDRPEPRAAVAWLLTMIGCFGVFVADDFLSFYFFYALVSIPAWAMFALDPVPETARAGRIYMAFAILGEAFLLFAFAMLAAGEPHGSLRIPDVVAALSDSPWRGAALALLIAGFGAKMGLVPLNGWMPLAYAATPIPAAAVLSGAGVKAGVIGLIRFLPLGLALVGWGEALTTIGFITAFFGVLVGLTQENPKAILGYSSVSQMGVIAAALGLGLAAGNADAASLVAFYGANHVLVKGALFLTVGAFAARGARPKTQMLLALALALSLAGLPFTGGALAKGASKPLFGYDLAATLAALSSAGSAMLMAHFVARLPDASRYEATLSPALLIRSWPVAALGALIVPYAFFPFAGEFGDALAPSKIWEGLWPVLLGGLLAFAWRRLGVRTPRAPVGDFLGVAEAAFGRFLASGQAFDRVDRAFRRWPAAGLALLAVVLSLSYSTGLFG